MKYLVAQISLFLILFSAYSQESVTLLHEGNTQLRSGNKFVTYISQRMFSINVTASTGSFYLTADSAANIVVYWGDGSFSEHTLTANIRTTVSHTYTSIGQYDINITGDLGKIILFNNISPLNGTISKNILKFKNLKNLLITNPLNASGIIPLSFDSLQVLYLAFTPITNMYTINFNEINKNKTLKEVTINQANTYGVLAENVGYIGNVTSLFSKKLEYIYILGLSKSEANIDSLKNNNVLYYYLNLGEKHKGDLKNLLDLNSDKLTILYIYKTALLTGDFTGRHYSNLSDISSDIDCEFDSMPVITSFSCLQPTTKTNVNYNNLKNKAVRNIAQYRNYSNDQSGDASYFFKNYTVSTRIDIVNNNVFGNFDSLSGIYASKTNILKGNFTGHLSSIAKHFTTAGSSITITSESLLEGLSGMAAASNFISFICDGNYPTYEINLYIDSLFYYKNNYNLAVAKTINISNNAGSPSGTFQQGSLGTYGGSVHNLTEAQIMYLANGLDYTGSGTNTPWTALEKIWALTQIKVNSGSVTARYKFTITY